MRQIGENNEFYCPTWAVDVCVNEDGNHEGIVITHEENEYVLRSVSYPSNLNGQHCEQLYIGESVEECVNHFEENYI